VEIELPEKKFIKKTIDFHKFPWHPLEAEDEDGKRGAA
jgi:hypothetical protein